MINSTFQYKLSTFRIWRYNLLFHILFPEVLFQKDHFILIFIIPFDFPDNNVILTSSIKTTKKYSKPPKGD